MVQWLRIHTPNAGGLSWILGEVTRSHTPQLKILHTTTEIKLSQLRPGHSQRNIKNIIHEPMDTLSSTKEARIYNGKKTTSLTSGAGNTGQPLVKE